LAPKAAAMAAATDGFSQMIRFDINYERIALSLASFF
jgi:hypothetical protein